MFLYGKVGNKMFLWRKPSMVVSYKSLIEIETFNLYNEYNRNGSPILLKSIIL